MATPTNAGAASPKGARTRSVVFEATFVRGLPQTPELIAALKAAGFDPANLAVDYPNQVFTACVDAAARVAFPGLAKEAAHRELGLRMGEGFAQTLLGKIVVAGLGFLSPMSLLKRYPSFMSMDDTDLRMTFEERGPNHGALRCTYLTPLYPEFTAGVLEAAVRLTKVKPTVTLQDVRPGSFVMNVTW